MCYADNSANTTLQCKTGTKYHFLINYIHIIQLVTELDTEVTKSLQASVVLLPQRVYPSKEHAKAIPPRQSTGAPALLDFDSLLLSFITQILPCS